MVTFLPVLAWKGLLHHENSGSQKRYTLRISQVSNLHGGFVEARELLKVADVPNFQATTTHEAIATNVLRPPVQQWQRPLIPEKKNEIISVFNNTGNYMPNPVLISENCNETQDIKVKQQHLDGGTTTNIFKIDIPEPEPNASKALWIIDGQHRITGLGDATCPQNANPIPVVFLLNAGAPTYDGASLAKIFAQVTTAATQLDTLHKEWLTFAFGLDRYAHSQPQRSAMETVATLCNTPVVDGSPNLFLNDIAFNDKLPNRPNILGHQYDCAWLARFIATEYFNAPSLHSHLAPSELAYQIARAFRALLL